MATYSYKYIDYEEIGTVSGSIPANPSSFLIYQNTNNFIVYVTGNLAYTSLGPYGYYLGASESASVSNLQGSSGFFYGIRTSSSSGGDFYFTSTFGKICQVDFRNSHPNEFNVIIGRITRMFYFPIYPGLHFRIFTSGSEFSGGGTYSFKLFRKTLVP